MYSYHVVNDDGTYGPAMLSVWPDWAIGPYDVPKVTNIPLRPDEDGAMPFNDWRLIGEEFMVTSNSKKNFLHD